ncbi:MAG: CBS domain-containing protein, partial [Bryobacterales bacterium]|nr:CBS domain-containing protein [Bryobacterales bacterium]
MLCQNLSAICPPACSAQDTASRVMDAMYRADTTVLPVVVSPEDRHLVGIITERDLIVRVDAAGRDPDTTPVAEVMSANPVCCTVDADPASIVRLMNEYSLRRLPVVDADGCLAGMVSLDDVLQHVGARTRQRRWAMAGGAGLCVAAGLGAGLMYLFDPNRGKTRRTQLRERATSLYHGTRRAIEHSVTDAESRAIGVAAELRRTLQDTAGVPDETLVARVRTHLGRVVTHPHTVKVSAENGRVTLSGTARPNIVKVLEDAVRKVPGVKAVENQLIAKPPVDEPATAGRHSPATLAKSVGNALL